MKKNLLTVVILALVVVNLLLNCVIIFTLVPETTKVNSLITQIASAIDLELNSDTSTADTTTVPIDQIVTYDIEDSMTINLKSSGDGVEHVAVLEVTLSMDSKNDDYKTYGSNIADRESLIKSTIIATVEQYTYDQMSNDIDTVKAAILKNLQDLYGSDFITSVEFRSKVIQ